MTVVTLHAHAQEDTAMSPQDRPNILIKHKDACKGERREMDQNDRECVGEGRGRDVRSSQPQVAT
jgi:hypothetical protein